MNIVTAFFTSCPPTVWAKINRSQVVRAWLAALVLLSAGSARAQFVTQTFNLRNGWNAIWLDVEPTNSSVNIAFAGAPLVSLWTFADRTTSVEYIEDANEPVWNRARWLVHVPTNRLESFQNSLFALSAKRAYLVNLTNSFTLRITGRPVWRPRAWAPDAYTLRGLPVDPESPVAFNDFFLPSPAHFNRATGRLQKIYRLNSLGQWSLVGPVDLINPGEAYWVYTQGGSDYAGPLSLKLDAGDTLDFGAGVSAAALELINASGLPSRLTVRDTTSPSPLSYQRLSSTNAVEWVPLTGAITQQLPPGGKQRLRLAIRRNDLNSAPYGSILEIRDSWGSYIPLAVSALKLTAGGGGEAMARGTAAPEMAGAAPNLAGLWVGNASIDAISEVNSRVDASTPTPVSSPFHLRLLVHVDSSGVARLLKEVVQLWRNGTATNDANGNPVLATPGHYALVTDERLFSQFGGATLIAGTPAGRRISTIGFDFESAPDGRFLTFTGTFGGNHELSTSIALGANFATNPFRHKFHPDHHQGYAVVRQISLQFSNAPPPGVRAVDYGYQVQAGTYRESLTGLNKRPITCQGMFQLTRVSDVAALNQ